MVECIHSFSHCHLFRIGLLAAGWLMLPFATASTAGVTGDIVHFTSLSKLTEIDVANTGVYGDIACLNSLPNLTKIFLGNTGVSGDIAHLKSLLKLTEIYLKNPGFFGDIANLKSLPNLRMVSLWDTCVTGNEELFHKSREDSGLEECRITF